MFSLGRKASSATAITTINPMRSLTRSSATSAKLRATPSAVRRDNTTARTSSPMRAGSVKLARNPIWVDENMLRNEAAGSTARTT